MRAARERQPGAFPAGREPGTGGEPHEPGDQVVPAVEVFAVAGLEAGESRVGAVLTVGVVRRAGVQGLGDGLPPSPLPRLGVAGAGSGSLHNPDSLRGLRDLALDRSPVGSHTLYGTEVPATVIRSRMLATARIVAVRDPDGRPLDRTVREDVKRRVLAAHFVVCGTRHAQGARITMYARPGRC
ncbi:hypothetical protein GR925_32180 [Streptomyces sp. HUCO-GS316]|uniref:hypothetical protein n=1 Tax=Streptomyces sp. HUCO-GS316 TaxID=2692198 RepID=UPI00136AF3A8|nr:hypothetical protein [Streptomyces sp. HUCO-GS316]MXM67970.1 hypothetical protein [Streptomyces sp. HUCO-GS316]